VGNLTAESNRSVTQGVPSHPFLNIYLDEAIKEWFRLLAEDFIINDKKLIASFLLTTKLLIQI
jgi:hypothetical protein